MVFMKDSVRAAELGQDAGIDLHLHLNLDQPFTGLVKTGLLQEHHDRIVRFLTSTKDSSCLCNPTLRREFRYVDQAQMDESRRLYGRRPSPIDRHHHTHIYPNMLLDRFVPARERVLRTFSFGSGEKNLLNRLYRYLVDLSLAHRYKRTDFFFSPPQSLQENRIARVWELSKIANVELMTHAVNPKEYTYLMSDADRSALSELETGNHGSL
jgi:predicted glycoside hydrolase/deacetylase ChbG (UPF0249 family)